MRFSGVCFYRCHPGDHRGRDPFNQNSDRSDREKRTTSKGGPVFSNLFRLDRTDPLSFGPKFPEILVEWIAPRVTMQRQLRGRGGGQGEIVCDRGIIAKINKKNE